MNSLSKTLAAAALVAGALSLVPYAHADGITFGSYAGTSTAGFANGTITSVSAGGPAVVASTAGYQTVISPTQFVTFANGTQPGTIANPVTTDYFTSISGDLTGYSGTISALADDTLSIYLNGQLLGSTTGAYDTLNVFNIPAGDFLASGNTLEFAVGNTGGVTAFDFGGSANAATPEPSSLILLGSGLVSAAGMVIRKRRA